MKTIATRHPKTIAPFDEPASALSIQNKQLWRHHRDLFSRFGSTQHLYVDSLDDLDGETGELLVYRDNLYFDDSLLATFLIEARKCGFPCQIAFAANDRSITEHAIYLQEGIKRSDGAYVAGLYYFPDGFSTSIQPRPLLVNTESRELWYLSVPARDYSLSKGLLFHYEIPDSIRFPPIRLFVPLKPFVSVESWVHLLFANFIWGIHSTACRLEDDIHRSLLSRWRMYVRASMERKPALQCSALVKKGKNCHIDSSAVIVGPTMLGNNVSVGPGAVITSSLIGDDVVVGQGCHILLSVIGQGSVLPFRTSTLMSCLMENVILNSTVRFSIIGRNTFIGDGVWFTDRNLVGKDIMDKRLGGEMVQTVHNGELRPTGYFVLGSAIGHNVKIATGHIIYPGRTIASNRTLTLAGSDSSSLSNVVIDRNVE